MRLIEAKIGKIGFSTLQHFISAGPNVGQFSNNNLAAYIEMDGVLTEEQGKKFEEMYEDKDYYILQHKYVTSSEYDKKNECFRHGKKSSTHYKEQKNQLDCTTTGTYNRTMSFQELIKNDIHKIIMRIPRKALDANSDIPVWGSNDEKGDSFILPEYVIGDYGPDGFEENPIPLKERTQYRIKYKDNSQIPMENTQQMSK